MDRKESIKTLLLGTASWTFLKPGKSGAKENPNTLKEASTPMRSRWTEWPDMRWVGPEFWGNRLQDWCIADGQVECLISASNRTLHCLTHQLGEGAGDFRIAVELELLNNTGSGQDRVGFRIGARAGDQPVRVQFEDYRRNAIYGEGLQIGMDANGRLFIGGERGDESISLQGPVRLELDATEAGGPYTLSLKAIDVSSGKLLGSLTAEGIEAGQLKGNVALLSHLSSQEKEPMAPSVRFSDWRISGSKVRSNPGQTFGPICFAQYTLDRGVLKITAQLAPVEMINGHKVELQLRSGGQWETVEDTNIHQLARTAHFRIEDWQHDEDIPFRIRLELPLKSGDKEYFYEGTITGEPVSADRVKMAVFSCNSHHGFPNAEVVENVKKHHPDIAMFLGDQIYESHGGFGAERTDDVERATLDYLRKWYMFGWSYRDIFRHIPGGFIPDDHDVFHGNIWGEGGKEAPTDKGWGYEAQDKGGYKYPPEWVRMVERTLTSHLPDPWDPTPIKQDIGVYYTDWTYGGVSLAILEDRKFKSAPGNVLPFEVVNGFPQDPDIDLSQYYDIDADLLGGRQQAFLEQWVADWSHGAKMKAVLSQSPFSGAHTMSKGATHDRNVPQQPIPPRGEYPSGDYPARDMDTNGWPQKGRDEALDLIRRGFALHIAGDQHLGSVIQYGVDEYRDAGFVFTGPALNNIWPRRWWPTVEEDHQPLVGRPKYTGNFKDAFGNQMTVLAVANPVQTNRDPGLIYDRVTGYGIVTFDKTDRSMRIECWPRYVDPLANPEGQYDGWPIVVSQQANYGRKAVGYLPEVRVQGLQNPVLQLYQEESDQLEYALRLQGDRFTPKVFDLHSTYTIRVGEPDQDRWQEVEGVTPGEDSEPIVYKFE
ncbi:alkaline phosphatase D family protein [Aliifodinibius salicampi]|uniref:Alkaline phosphatase D family protein n=1 Tax=Fodinibius salicampi TaxID=1920655 RepID=A0ABT3PXY7_9BACT|nr:alkaline phosphatase D family protein [Fodinibius salicampi]MCW9712732.1 alkaline phosphatase D family protein [Fodinibius salicampi]